MLIKGLSIKGVILGSFTVVVTSVMLSILMPVFFWDLIKSGKSDVLITSFLPQLYSLGVVLISGVFGVYIGAVVANKVALLNSIVVILISLLLVYVLNSPVREFASVPPFWFSVASYSLCLVSLILGHFLSKKLIKNKATSCVNST